MNTLVEGSEENEALSMTFWMRYGKTVMAMELTGTMAILVKQGFQKKEWGADESHNLSNEEALKKFVLVSGRRKGFSFSLMSNEDGEPPFNSRQKHRVY